MRAETTDTEQLGANVQEVDLHGYLASTVEDHGLVRDIVRQAGEMRLSRLRLTHGSTGRSLEAFGILDDVCCEQDFKRAPNARVKAFPSLVHFPPYPLTGMLMTKDVRSFLCQRRTELRVLPDGALSKGLLKIGFHQPTLIGRERQMRYSQAELIEP